MVSQQQEEYAHKQRLCSCSLTVLKDKDSAVQVLTQELTNNKEHSLLELEQDHQDAEPRAQVVRTVFAHGLSTQPHAAPVETFQGAVAHAIPVQAHSPAFSIGASANNVNLRARSEEVVPWLFLCADAPQPRHRLLQLREFRAWDW